MPQSQATRSPTAGEKFLQPPRAVDSEPSSPKEEATTQFVAEAARLAHDPAGAARLLLELSEERRNRMTDDDIRPEYRALRHEIIGHLHSVYGAERKMRFSKSIHPDGFSFFATVVSHLPGLMRPVNFLEVGTFEGVSLSVVGSLLRATGQLGSLSSVDPYFSSGYSETNPIGGTYIKQSTKTTRASAMDLFHRLSLSVRQMETASEDGLRQLIKEDRSFELIYIDGMHNGLSPIIDFGLSMTLLSPGGIIVLDDWAWPEIILLKGLCDRNLMKLAETPDIVAYRRK